MRDGEQDFRDANSREIGRKHVKWLLDATLQREEDIAELRRDEAKDYTKLWADRFERPEAKGLEHYARALNQLGAHIEAVGHRVADGAIRKLENAPLESHPTWGEDALRDLQEKLERELTSWAYGVGNDLDCAGAPDKWAARVNTLHATGAGIGAAALLQELEGKDGAAGRLGRLRRARESLASIWQEQRERLSGGYVPPGREQDLSIRLDAAKDDALRVLNESPSANAFHNAIVPIIAVLAWFAAPWLTAASATIGTGPMPPNTGSIPLWLLDVLLWSIPEGLALAFGPVGAPFTGTALFMFATWSLLRYQRARAEAHQARLLGPQGRVRAELLSAARRSHVAFQTRADLEDWINRTVCQAVDRSLRALTRYAHQVRSTERQLRWLDTWGFPSLWAMRAKTDTPALEEQWTVAPSSDVTFVLNPPSTKVKVQGEPDVQRPSPLWTDDLSPGASGARADTLLWPRRFLKRRGLHSEWSPIPSLGTLAGTSRFGPLQDYGEQGAHFILRNETSAVWQRMERLETVGEEKRKWLMHGIGTLPLGDDLRVVWLHRKELPR